MLTGSGFAEGVSLALDDAGGEEAAFAGVVAGVFVGFVVGVVAGLSAFLVEVGSNLDVVTGSCLWTTSTLEGFWVSFACASESLHASSLVVPSSSLKVPALRPAQTSFKGTV